MSTRSMNKRFPRKCNIQGNLTKKGSPVRACLVLASCLTPVRCSHSREQPRKDYIPSDAQARKPDRSYRDVNKLAIYLERKHVGGMKCEGKTPLNGVIIPKGLKSLIDSQSDSESVSLIDTRSVSDCADTTDAEIDLEMRECPPEEINLPDPLWYHYSGYETVPGWDNVYQDNITKISDLDKRPTLNLSNVTINHTTTSISSNATTMDVDLDLTPPSSTDLGGISSSDSEYDFPHLLVNEERVSASEWPKLRTYGQDEPKQQPPCSTDICKELEVRIIPVAPTLKQFQDLYNREKFKRKANDRHSYLRPRHALRQFVPFAIDAPMYQHSRRNGKKLHSRRRRKLKGPSSKKSDNTLLPVKKFKSNVTKKTITEKKAIDEAKLVLSAAKTQLKTELREKKEAFKQRNKYENALGSINQRLFRQNSLWRMLPN